MNKMIKSYATMTVYDLKMECKRLKIRGYSKLRKKELRELVENYTRKEQVKTMETEETIFCYPEILKTIYSYVDVDNTNEERKKLLQDPLSKQKILKKYLAEYNKKRVRERKGYLLSIGFRNKYDIVDRITQCEILSYEYEKLIKCNKSVLYIWLKGLEYKVTQKIKKKEMKEMVEKYYKEIMN